jgi:hypothetical protein
MKKLPLQTKRPLKLPIRVHPPIFDFPHREIDLENEEENIILQPYIIPINIYIDKNIHNYFTHINIINSYNIPVNSGK